MSIAKTAAIAATIFIVSTGISAAQTPAPYTGGPLDIVRAILSIPSLIISPVVGVAGPGWPFAPMAGTTIVRARY